MAAQQPNFQAVAQHLTGLAQEAALAANMPAHNIAGLLVGIDQRLQQIEAGMQQMNGELQQMNGRLQQVEGGLQQVDDRLQTMQEYNLYVDHKSVVRAINSMMVVYSRNDVFPLHLPGQNIAHRLFPATRRDIENLTDRDIDRLEAAYNMNIDHDEPLAVKKALFCQFIGVPT